MESVNRLLDTTVGELEKILTTRTVVGDPIEVDGHTIIPLISVGFGFGGGGGTGTGGASEGEGTGGGTGGGGGVKPVGVIVIDDDGVRVEPIRGSAAAVVEKLGSSVTDLVERVRREKSGGEDEEESGGEDEEESGGEAGDDGS